MAANQKGKQLKNFGQVSVVENDHNDELLTVSDGNSKPFEEWVLDSGCTLHMCPNRYWFSTYEIVSKCAILMDNNASCNIAGVAIVRIKMFDGIVITLGDVKHDPDLKRNLISLSTLDSKWYKYTGQGGALKHSKGAIIVMKG